MLKKSWFIDENNYLFCLIVENGILVIYFK